MNQTDLLRLLKGLADEIFCCSELILNAHRKLFSIGVASTIKDDGTLLTAVDTEINGRLLQWAHQHQLGFVGEEGVGEKEGTFILNVDPLNGTTAFLRGMNTSTIIASVMHMKEGFGEPIAAIIHQPLGEKTWMSVKGAPSRLNLFPNAVSPKNILMTNQSTTGVIRSSICVFPGASHQLNEVQKIINADPRFAEQQLGAFGYGGCLIASNLLDVTAIGATAALEATALSLLIRNAGGIALDLTGNELRCFKLGTVLGKVNFELPQGALFAANKKIAETVLQIIATVQ